MAAVTNEKKNLNSQTEDVSEFIMLLKQMSDSDRMYVKEAYDNRDRTAPTDDKVRFAVQSMMLKERLK